MKEFLKRHPHLPAQLWWIFYLVFFCTLEKLVVTPRYWIKSPLDDLIPFNEWFVFLYGSWFIYLLGAIIFCYLTSTPDYDRMCKVLFVGMTLCLVLYVIFPNGQQLRPEALPDNLPGKLMGLVYLSDSPCNVCPSIHCFSSAGIHLVLRRHPLFARRKGLRWASGLLAAGICLSTVVVKQHSVVDLALGVALAFPLALLFNRKAPVREQVKKEQAKVV